MENWQNPYETRESLYRGWELHELGRRLSAIALALLVLMLAQKGLGLLALLVRQALRARGWGMGPAAVLGQELIVYLLSLALPILLLHLLCPLREEEPACFALPRPGFFLPAAGMTVGAAVLAGMASSLLTALLGRLLGGTIALYRTTILSGAWPMLLSAVSAAVTPALMEELLFRGAVFRRLQRFGDGFAVVFSALLFALCHTTVGQMLPAFVSGLFLALFAVRSGSLLTPMLIHFLYNFLVFLAAAWGLYGGEAGSRLSGLVFAAFGLAAFLLSYGALGKQYGEVFRLAPGSSGLSRGDRIRAVLTNIPTLVMAGMFLYTTVGAIRVS